MKRAANAQLRMLNAVINFLDEEVEQLNQIPRLAEQYEALKSLHQSIRDLSTQKSSDIKGITDERNDLRSRVNFVAIQLSGTLISYARANDLKSMEQRIRFTPSDLSSTSINKNLNFLETLLSTAEGLGVDILDAYGWNQGRLDGYRTLVEQFALQMTSPREAIASRAALTKEMYKLLDQSTEMLVVDIDPLMLLFTDEQQRMVDNYFGVRKVVLPGARAGTSEEVRDESMESGGASGKFGDQSIETGEDDFEDDDGFREEGDED